MKKKVFFRIYLVIKIKKSLTPVAVKAVIEIPVRKITNFLMVMVLNVIAIYFK